MKLSRFYRGSIGKSRYLSSAKGSMKAWREEETGIVLKKDLTGDLGTVPGQACGGPALQDYSLHKSGKGEYKCPLSHEKAIYLSQLSGFLAGGCLR